jgi:hypothetical protein
MRLRKVCVFIYKDILCHILFSEVLTDCLVRLKVDSPLDLLVCYFINGRSSQL